MATHNFSCTPEEQHKIMIIWIPLLSVTGTCLLPPIFSFIKAYFEKKLISSKILFCLGLLFYLTICTLFIILSLTWSLYCKINKDLSKPQDPFRVNIIYTFQSAILVTILFTRLVSIFKGTELAISTIVKVTFMTLTVILVLNSIAVDIFAEIVHESYTDMTTYMYLLGFLLYITEFLWLNILFLYKLYKLNKTDNVGQDKMVLKIMIKTTVLSVLSSISSFLTMIVTAIAIAFGDESFYVQTFAVIFGIIDLYTNFYSVLLSYRYYDKWYQMLCGKCCNKFCVCFCYKFKKDIEMMETISTENHSTL